MNEEERFSMTSRISYIVARVKFDELLLSAWQRDIRERRARIDIGTAREGQR